MRRWMITLASVAVAFLACGDEPASLLASDMVRALDEAKSRAAWRWECRSRIDPLDEVFQSELRVELEARHSIEYRDALASSGKSDDPRMRGLRNVLVAAASATPTMRQVAEASSARGFTADIQLYVGTPELSRAADGRRLIGASLHAAGRSSNVTSVLRASLKQVRRLGHDAVITPENMPVSWYECQRKDRPVFQSRCQNVAGCFKYSCSYRMSPEAECPWRTTARELGQPRVFADVDRENVWELLARSPLEYAFSDVLKVLGRPRQSMRMSCSNCKATEMRWAYDVRDIDEFGISLRHLLVFLFAPDGRCTGWYWESV